MKPDGFTAVMNQRVEGADSLDDFPTPPWATRALCEIVFPKLDIPVSPIYTAHEPACGRGIMAEVLTEYFGVVLATDIHEYGYHEGSIDFLAGEHDEEIDGRDFNFIVTNPPFRLACDFTLRALQEARHVVAMLVRANWAEGGGRYARLFRPRPPMAIAQFCERVPMVKGRWDPEATTATAYAWFVWHRLETQAGDTRFLWIPPGQRKALTRPDDVERFAR